MSGVVAEQVDEQAKERVPEHEARRGGARRRVHPSYHQKVRHQEEVLGRVVQHHRMADADSIGELHAPPDAGGTAHDLSVDEIAKPAEAHQERSGDDQFVRQFEQRLVVRVSEDDQAERRAEEEAVRGHASEPVGGHHPGVVAIEGPLIEEHLDRAAPEENTDGDQEAERVYLLARQRQSMAASGQEPVNLKEAERIAEAVPPEAQSANLREHGIEPMDEWASHSCAVSPAFRPCITCAG